MGTMYQEDNGMMGNGTMGNGMMGNGTMGNGTIENGMMDLWNDGSIGSMERRINLTIGPIK
jgi:hypothetical protein